MDINTKFLLIILLSHFLSCTSEVVSENILETITKEDIALFSNIGINARFVSNKSQARFQWRDGNKFCDLNYEAGTLSSNNCVSSNFSQERAKKIINRFIELRLTGITDIDGEGNIVFQKGKMHYLYSIDITIDELKSKMSKLKSMNLIGNNWYLLKLEE